MCSFAHGTTRTVMAPLATARGGRWRTCRSPSGNHRCGTPSQESGPRTNQGRWRLLGSVLPRTPGGTPTLGGRGRSPDSRISPARAPSQVHGAPSGMHALTGPRLQWRGPRRILTGFPCWPGTRQANPHKPAPALPESGRVRTADPMDRSRPPNATGCQGRSKGASLSGFGFSEAAVQCRGRGAFGLALSARLQHPDAHCR